MPHPHVQTIFHELISFAARPTTYTIHTMHFFGAFQIGPGLLVHIGIRDHAVIRLTLNQSRADFLAAFTHYSTDSQLHEDNGHVLILDAAKQLKEYFELKRKVFELPLQLNGTSFQRRVWEALRTIPYGQTRTYSQIAAAVGAPGAARAVGGANHSNPIAIVVPCHRVLNTGGGLGGYASGLKIKRMLLELESAPSFTF